MTVADHLRAHLAESGESMSALSLRAGLGAKAVADILNIAGLAPRHKTLVALSQATGRDLLAATATGQKTYAELIATARDSGDKGLTSKLRWLCRTASWTPELKTVCKEDVIEVFDTRNAATVGLSPGSFATYRSDLLKAVSTRAATPRKKRIDDIGGIHRALYDAIVASELPLSVRYACGPFLLYLHAETIAPREITAETLAAYYAHRLGTSTKGQATCEKHVREIASLLRRLNADPGFARFAVPAVPHPFTDARDKFRVDAGELAPCSRSSTPASRPGRGGSCRGMGFPKTLSSPRSMRKNNPPLSRTRSPN